MRNVLRHLPLLAVLGAAATLLPAAGAFAASTWTPAASFAVGKGYEPVPRVAIASDGTSVLAFQSKSGKLMLSQGSPGGRFTPPRVIDREGGVRDWSVAARAGGGFIVVWEYPRGIRALVRAKHGSSTFISRVADSSREEINGVQVAADPLGGWVIAEREFRRTKDRFYYVRVMSVDNRGQVRGAIQDLGPGEFGIDARPTQALAVDDAGRAILTFVPEARFSSTAPAPTAVISTRPHGGAFSAPVALPGDTAADPRVAVGDGGRALIAATQVRSRGDAGVFGNPVVASIGPAGALGTPFGPAVDTPRRAFGPNAAFTSGGRSVLVFSLKTSSQPFETRAPVRAVAISATGGIGPLQTLTSARAKEPVVMPLAGGRALAMWSGERGLGAAFAGGDGKFNKTAEPAGPPPPPFHTNSTNRDLRTGGRYAIFTWSRDADGHVRVSIRKF
jgi:hypothetical protein